MKSVGVSELKEHLSEILRQVQDEGETIEVINSGAVVARLIPVQQPAPPPTDYSAVWAELDKLAGEISAHWPDGVSAVDAVRDVRRDL